MINPELREAVKELLNDVFSIRIEGEVDDNTVRLVIQQMGLLDQKESAAICMKYGIARKKLSNKDIAAALSTPSVTHALGKR